MGMEKGCSYLALGVDSALDNDRLSTQSKDRQRYKRFFYLTIRDIRKKLTWFFPMINPIDKLRKSGEQPGERG
jgi:hypothetical protein